MTLFLAMCLDAAFGEPKWLWSRAPHPAVLMGRAVDALDHRLNSGPNRRAKGSLALAVLVIGAVGLGVGLAAIPGQFVDLVVLAILLAQRSLADHVLAVAQGLRMSLAQGRQAVAQIVSRDTTQMQPDHAARAAIESGAENLSDGVIAPAFWFAIAGLPGLLVYKITNTADSMIGYRTPRYAKFGWAAARFDDVLNWVPARLTALLVLVVTGKLDKANAVWAQAPLHRSPNAGWPEAAVAHAQGVALSGPRVYDGVLTQDPFVNEAGRKDLTAADISAVVTLLWKVWAAALAVALCLAAVS